MRRTLYLLFVLLTVLLCGCQPAEHHRFDPAQVSFNVSYEPLFSGRIYPSYILGIDQKMEADTQSLFTVSLVSPVKDAVLRVVVDSSQLNYVTILQEVMPERGKTYTYHPKVKWKYDKLYNLRQQGTVDLTFVCYVNDEEVDVKNMRLNYRSVNECLLSARKDGVTHNFKWLFAGYVNEDHPYIDQILSDILAQGVVQRFSGYQSGTVTPQAQVFAIWNYALERGIGYSSISCTSNPSNTANVQHIRFFDEVYNTRQANCIDACVFFASILRKIGLKPVIFVEPCHAYLGYYTDRQRRHLALLETTMTSWVNFPSLQRSLDADGRLPDEQMKKIRKYLTDEQATQYESGKMTFDELKLAVSKSLFDKATDYERENYEKNKAAFADPSNMSYQQLDIEQLRKQVQPIN